MRAALPRAHAACRRRDRSSARRAAAGWRPSGAASRGGRGSARRPRACRPCAAAPAPLKLNQEQYARDATVRLPSISSSSPPVISFHTVLSAFSSSALIDVADLHRLAQAERAGIRLLLPDHHPEQRRLAGAVRPDDPDDAARRQREVHIVHQQHVAVALAELARFDDHVAEPRTGGDVDLRAVGLLRRVRPRAAAHRR